MKKNELIDIGDVSKQSGVSVSTLRFYEEKGLIKSVSRNGLRRLFDINVLENLSLISLGRYAGFSLDEIKDVFIQNTSKNINREKLLNKIDELDKTIHNLIAVKNTIQHIVNCPEQNQMNCPKFQSLLKEVSKKCKCTLQNNL